MLVLLKNPAVPMGMHYKLNEMPLFLERLGLARRSEKSVQSIVGFVAFATYRTAVTEEGSSKLHWVKEFKQCVKGAAKSEAHEVKGPWEYPKTPEDLRSLGESLCSVAHSNEKPVKSTYNAKDLAQAVLSLPIRKTHEGARQEAHHRRQASELHDAEDARAAPPEPTGANSWEMYGLAVMPRSSVPLRTSLAGGWSRELQPTPSIVRPKA